MQDISAARTLPIRCIPISMLTLLYVRYSHASYTPDSEPTHFIYHSDICCQARVCVYLYLISRYMRPEGT